MQINVEVSEIHSLIAAVRDRTSIIEREVQANTVRPSVAAMELATLERVDRKLRDAAAERQADEERWAKTRGTEIH